MKSNDTKPIKFAPTVQTLSYLRRFAKLGLYGNSEPAVASALLNKQIIELVTDGTLEKLEAQQKHLTTK